MNANYEAMKDRFRGCLMGGAAGDALGYEVEFLSNREIKKRFGEGGIRRYVLHGGVALISDDTQMTLYTANGLLCGAAVKCDEDGYREYIRRCYLDWLTTQREWREKASKGKISWLNGIARMNSRRAPGGTCLSALEMGGTGTMDAPINNRKGCGGVMRTAPVGLLFRDEEVCQRLGAAAAAITHGHELGYLPAAMLSGMVCILVNEPEVSVREAAERSKAVMEREFSDCADVQSMSELIDYALQLADMNMEDVKAIRQLGEGWVGDEALAIAVYSAVKYENDFEGCLAAAVNHDGDSDSTGAIAGNILGAKLGMAGIPEYYLTDLELREEILTMADDLFEARREADGGQAQHDWREKYVRTDEPEEIENEEIENEEIENEETASDEITAEDAEQIKSWIERLLEKLEK